ncbi:hypothetical protein HY502_01610 [Candidatus Woesebacteria bacterium]|nr:hypothetical protein [Candidatus Woesebacteria bacterium]
MLTALAINIVDKFDSPFGRDRTIGDLVSLFLKGSFVLAGIFILVLFLVAGFSIIQGAGSNNPEAAQKGKSAATSALIGFVVVFGAYWVIRIIEVITGNNFITEPGL